MRKMALFFTAITISFTLFLVFRARETQKVEKIYIDDVAEVKVKLLPPISDIEDSFVKKEDISFYIDKINSYEYIPSRPPVKKLIGNLQYTILGKVTHFIVFYEDNDEGIAKYDGRWYKLK